MTGAPGPGIAQAESERSRATTARTFQGCPLGRSMPHRKSAAEQVLEKLQKLAGQLATAVASQDQAASLALCVRMSALQEALEVMEIPRGGPDLENLKRHIHFANYYSTQNRWTEIRSEPADCLTDIASLISKIGEAERASEPWWELIHPKIRLSSEPIFSDGHYTPAVLQAFIAINERVKEHVRSKGLEPSDGTALMRQALKTDGSTIRIPSPTIDSEDEIQEGYQHIFAGSMLAIRDPKAHASFRISKEQAAHLIFLASHLMFKLDEAGVP
jgi:uncharacterized protein (TIGR02391 family)